MEVDELFDGWLSVPASIGAFLEYEQQEPNQPPHLDPRISNPQRDTSKESISNGNASSKLLPYRLNHGGLSPPRPAQSPDSTQGANATIRKRRAHTKSRLGCVNCRKKKIKCQETWPACGNCIKRGVLCRYPTVHYAHQDRPAPEVTSPRSLVQLRDTPTVFTANDMRLFHHFLTAAHPCVPYQKNTIWVKDVPTLSHQFDYLMHAILALSGSHLSIYVDDPPTNRALDHRQKAITGLEKAFERWPPRAEEAHVMLATSFMLAYQSGFMSDGFLDHILSLRGCTMLSQLIQEQHLHGVFSMDPTMNNAPLEIKLLKLPNFNKVLARDALKSLTSLSHHLGDLSSHAIERAIYELLIECVEPLLGLPVDQADTSTSPSTTSLDSSSITSQASTPESPYHLSPSRPSIKDPVFPGDIELSYSEFPRGDVAFNPSAHSGTIRAFNATISSFLILSTWPQEAVLYLFSPTNMLGHILIAHFVCIRFCLSPLAAPESAMNAPITAMVEWCEKYVAEVDDADAELEARGGEKGKWTRYLEWPKSVLRSLRICINQKRGMMFGDLYRIMVEEPDAFRAGTVIV
ncbi:hypothetical protein P154DRAFT_323434 [Amniculicola lignicola CBS 123094]|uniref:Zn(2)-C6 fungal-type domain-containing protein n=1 Tax=Amniculicola lignicola CBS 123094 TaxID=1392246 RepID=A0A6A5W2R3_9PLEO|nr:hypothetical protein P154DRAFT_323434 [Amniculicola lignicola CBS 123094]